MSKNKITTKELLEKLDKGESVTILDVRSNDKIENFQITHPNIENVNIEKTQFLNEDEINPDVLTTLSNSSEMVIVCTTGNSANKVAEKLEESGIKVTVLEGGVTSWKEQIEKE
jgi:rhodanese-related sulfurtransferase